ncbi:hypothetical protein L1987_26594 [Smallanthus sonchifolius]|uniref:Uncharacterized protein n=1 Tax=Smallanthus sonchifolius TaxID=185202 RepID=A0ACB9IBN9_9ASTR|nr:hypothetical protein L1987_26594 [Smallanthus sonchifolius]
MNLTAQGAVVVDFSGGGAKVFNFAMAEKDIDEVHVQITLLPETDEAWRQHTQRNCRFYGNLSSITSDILLSSLPRPPAAGNSHCVKTIVTGAGDETLGFWNVFPSPKSQVWKLCSRDLCGIAHNSV